MQLFLDANELFHEELLVEILKEQDREEKEYSRILEKNAKGKKLTELEKECIANYKPLHTDFMNKGYSENKFRQYIKIDPSWFADYIKAYIMYSLMKLRKIIMKYDIDRVYLFFQKEPFPYWEKEMKYSLTEDFIYTLTKDLNEIKTIKDDLWMTSAYYLVKLYEGIVWDTHVYGKGGGKVYGKGGGKVYEFINHLLEFRRRHHIISQREKYQAIKLTKSEKEKILNISFESCYNSKFLISNNIQEKLKDLVYYSFEDLDDQNIEFLSMFKNTLGISFYVKETHSHDYIEVFKLLQKINFRKARFSRDSIYKMDFLSALDDKFNVRLDFIFDHNNEDRYFIVKSADKFIKRRIKAYYTKKVETKLDEFKNNIPIANKYLIIENFENLSVTSQNNIWRKLENSVFKDGFVLFFMKPGPGSEIIPNELDENVWEHHDDQIKNNISKIFHALLTECSKDDLDRITLDRVTIELINKNEFADLIGITNISLDKLLKSIKSALKIDFFDYESCENWYYFREDYNKRIESSEELKNEAINKKEVLPKATFTFINDDNSWEVRELNKNIIDTPYTNSSGTDDNIIFDLEKYIGKNHSNENQSQIFNLKFVHRKDEKTNEDYWAISDNINNVNCNVPYLNSLALLYIVYMKKYQELFHKNKIETDELYRSVKKYQCNPIKKSPMRGAKHYIDNAFDAYFYPITNEDQYKEKLKNKVKKESKKDLLKIKRTLSKLFDEHIEIGNKVSSFNITSNIRITVEDKKLKSFLEKQ